MDQEHALKFAMSDAAIVAAVRHLQQCSGMALIVHRRTVEQMAELVPDARVMTVQELANDMEKMEEGRPIILTNFDAFLYAASAGKGAEYFEAAMTVADEVYCSRHGKSLIVIPVPDESIYQRAIMVYMNRTVHF